MKKRPRELRDEVIAAVRLKDPSPEQRTPEELLADLEQLDLAVRRKVEISTAPVRKRYETDLAPLLEQVRELVSRGSARGRNAALDALVRFREFLLTAGAPIV